MTRTSIENCNSSCILGWTLSQSCRRGTRLRCCNIFHNYWAGDGRPTLQIFDTVPIIDNSLVRIEELFPNFQFCLFFLCRKLKQGNMAKMTILILFSLLFKELSWPKNCSSIPRDYSRLRNKRRGTLINFWKILKTKKIQKWSQCLDWYKKVLKSWCENF